VSEPEASEPTSRARRSTYLRSGVAALIVLVVIGLGINFLFLSPKTPSHSLPGTEVAASLARSIQAQRRTSTPPDVQCPANIVLRAGATFTCVLIEKPHPVVIDVTQIDARGDFRLNVTGAAPGPPATPTTA
jgi:hypothetical protein